jgi:hypothetical protein
MGERENAYKILVQKPEEEKQLARSTRRRMILKLILKKNHGVLWTGFNRLRFIRDDGL